MQLREGLIGYKLRGALGFRACSPQRFRCSSPVPFLESVLAKATKELVKSSPLLTTPHTPKIIDTPDINAFFLPRGVKGSCQRE